MKNLILFAIVGALIWLMIQFPHTMLNPGELVQAHQKLNSKCLDCHQPLKGISNEKCIACHKLAEIGDDTVAGEKKILFHEKLVNEKCTSCHSDHKGLKPDNPLSGFKHNLLAETVISNCNSCHKKPVDTLHKLLSSVCNNCHNTNGWKSSVVFNHEMIQGADKNNCTGCHQKPSDSYHLFFKDNCNQCHSTAKWVPSTFDHSKYFRLDGDHNAKCNTCHTNNNFSIYTCYGCHEHSEGKIRNEHNEEGIYNFTDCARCHKSGNEHDIERNENGGERLNQQDINGVKDYIKSDSKEGKKEHDDD